MPDTELLELLQNNVLLAALSAFRVSVVFALMPLFAREGIPALIRNSMYLALAVISIAVQPPGSVEALTSSDWITLFGKEALIGAIIGVFFGIYLWAFEAAGAVIDMQIGASFALYQDPIVGNEVTLLGGLLGRFATYVFLASGGLLLMAGALLESFAIWPVLQPIDGIRAASVMLFEAELSNFMHFVIRIAGPIMVVIFGIDLAMGLVNRSAQQFNVAFLSMSLKSIASLFVLILLLPFIVDIIVTEMQVQASGIESYLDKILTR